MKLQFSKALSLLLVLALLLTMLPTAALAVDDEEEAGIIRNYGAYDFVKVSNPTSGSGEPDGINTDDLTGYDANRLNSYAWAVVSRGEYIYIGTNRTLFGSALNAVIENQMAGAPLTREQIIDAIETLSGGDMPVDLSEEDYIPQIIKVDVNNGCTEVIYEPATGYSDEDVLCYLDKDGNVVENADVASETASFRSVIEFNGNLYFGSLGSNMISLVRIDEEDNAEIVYQTVGLVSSLRANCRYDDGTWDTIYFGGFDTTYGPWRLYRYQHPEDTRTMPIVIRRLDPATAGTDAEDWSSIVADFRDFGKYAGAGVYVNGGGNVWDLCSYNGCIYLVLGYDAGWALFRGEKADDGDPDANTFGWKWTEIVGDDSIYGYPLGMNEELAELNASYTEAYNGLAYGANLRTVGLLESTATPYVYNGKMYIGTFDNATAVQSETVVKAIRKLSAIAEGDGDPGPSLASIFGPIYQVLSHPQHIWVMDENEVIEAVEPANALLEGTTNDYVWRFIEYDGKLFTGTFDAASAYTYFLNGPISGIINSLQANGVVFSDDFQALRNGTYRTNLLKAIDEAASKDLSLDALLDLRDAIESALTVMEAFLNDEAEVEDLQAAMQQLQDAYDAVYEDLDVDHIQQIQEVLNKIRYLLSCIDVEGLQLWAQARALANRTQRGFDVFMTDDGETWEPVVRDGLGDPYNYGARTFTICQDELYIGTANPYWGAQLWKLTEAHVHSFGEPEWEWFDDHTADVSFTCEFCDYTEVLEADVEEVVDLEPTCTEDGSSTCYGSVYFEGNTYTDEHTFTLDALTHNWDKPEWTWAEDYSAATAYFFCWECNEEEELEAEIEVRTLIPATCISKGAALYIATVELDSKTYTSRKLVYTPKEDHVYGEPEWDWAEDYSEVYVTFRCENCRNAYTYYTNEIEGNVQLPTCTEAGYVNVQASVVFEDGDGETYTDIVDEELEPLGHSWSKPDWYWAEDYSSATATFTCLECFEDEDVEAEVSANVIIPENFITSSLTIYTAIAEHEGESFRSTRVVTTPELTHTFGEPEWIWSDDEFSASAKFTCVDCNLAFVVDAEMDMEILDAPTCTEGGSCTMYATVNFNGEVYCDQREVDLDPLGHFYGEPEWTWSEDNTEATATFYCELCEESQEVPADVSSLVVIGKNCTRPGVTIFTAKAWFDDEEYTARKVMFYRATGHNYSEPVWYWSEDGSAAEAYFVCENCGEEKMISADVDCEVTVEPACGQPGEMVCTATILLDDEVYTDELTVELDALSHNWDRPTWNWAEDYSAATASFYCWDCDETLDVEAEINSRTIVSENHDHAGITVYTATAELEGELYRSVRIKVNGAEGHDFGEPQWYWAEDYESATAIFSCSCGVTVIIDADLEYNYNVIPSCTEPGEMEITAYVELEGEVYSDVVTVEEDPFGHYYDDPEWYWNEDYTEATAIFTCWNCEEIEELEANVTTLTLVRPTETRPGLQMHVAAVELEGKTYRSTRFTVLHPTEHSYGDPYWAWNEDYTAATAYFYCDLCYDMLEIEADVDQEILVEATGFECGMALVTATVSLNGQTYSDIQLVELPKLDSDEHECPCVMFEDMPEFGTPEHDAIDWAYTEGITAGMSETRFGVGETLTRAQAATFLYAAAGKPEFDVSTASNRFSDVKKNKWYTVAVLWAAEQGLFEGYPDGKFKPNETLTRAQILTVLYAWAGKPSNDGLTNPYSDAGSSKWYHDPAIWAYYEGIEIGKNGKFKPNTPCARETMVLYLYRYLTHNDLAD